MKDDTKSVRDPHPQEDSDGKVRFSVSVSPELKEQITACADNEGRSMAGWVRHYLKLATSVSKANHQ